VELSFDLRKADRGMYGYERGVLVVNLPAALDATNKKAVRVSQYRGGPTKAPWKANTARCSQRMRGIRESVIRESGEVLVP
jgi:hypothetical protein